MLRSGLVVEVGRDLLLDDDDDDDDDDDEEEVRAVEGFLEVRWKDTFSTSLTSPSRAEICSMTIGDSTY